MVINVNELKKELTKLSGVDFFNPKYRNVFKKYFPTDGEGLTEEEKKLKELVGEGAFEDDELDTAGAENLDIDDTDADDTDNKGEESQKTNDEESVDKTSENNVVEKTDDEATTDSFADQTTNSDADDGIDTSVAQESQTSVVSEPQTDSRDIDRELIDTKIELELVKAGVRKDRLDVAKKLMKSEINGVQDIGRIQTLIKDFPEWLEGFQKGQAAPFGITLGGSSDELTAEERRLKDFGVDPR